MAKGSSRAICRVVTRAAPDIACEAQPTAGSLFNIENVVGGALELGIAQSDWQFHAVNRSGPFEFADGNYGGLKALFSLHRDLLEEEARADLRRLGLIAGLGGAAAAMGFVSAMSLGVVVILGIQRLSGLPLLESVAIGMGGTILFMLVLLASAVSLFRKPFLRRSRLLLTRTWASLTRDDPDGSPPGGPASVAEA